ncbi:MAG: hypothetical protein HY069_01885 [Chlamydiia bacterium]|nr:hypothetical protein [Chlamydiia bacterium]
MRVACYIFGALISVCTGIIATSVLLRRVTPWFLAIAVLGLFAGGKWFAMARSIIDRNDPKEVARVREAAKNATFTDLLKQYGCNYDKIRFVVTDPKELQRKCLLSLQATDSSSLSLLRDQAANLLQQGLISQNLHTLLKTDSKELQATYIQRAATRELGPQRA